MMCVICLPSLIVRFLFRSMVFHAVVQSPRLAEFWFSENIFLGTLTFCITFIISYSRLFDCLYCIWAEILMFVLRPCYVIGTLKRHQLKKCSLNPQCCSSKTTLVMFSNSANKSSLTYSYFWQRESSFSLSLKTCFVCKI